MSTTNTATILQRSPFYPRPRNSSSQEESAARAACLMPAEAGPVHTTGHLSSQFLQVCKSVRVVSRSSKQQPLDAICLLGDNFIDATGHRNYSERCRHLQLRGGVFTPQSLPSGLFAEIDHWHRNGQFSETTHVALHGHGLMFDGRHQINFGSSTVTLEIVRALREGGLKYGGRYWPGCIEIDSCFGSELFKALADIEGLHVVVGLGPVPVLPAWHLSIHMLALLQQQKETGVPLSPQTIFQHLVTVSPLPVAVVGKGVPTGLTSRALTPELLANASPDQIRSAFLQQICSGTPASVTRFVAAWPWLMNAVESGGSVLDVAVQVERPDNLQTLLEQPVDWSDKLDSLLRVALNRPSFLEKALDLSTRAFSQRAAAILNAIHATGVCEPFQLRAEVMQLALEHLERSLKFLNANGYRALYTDMVNNTQCAQADSIWNLIDRIGHGSAKGCRLPEAQVPAFIQELLDRLARHVLSQSS
jgi:hypothetical protein